ncbi:LOW QUALITY PROTEIN: deoxyuridine 5'-triphosphate nucleotidohydrolase-like, partial [Haliotis rubra]|uniref:LOW QUALITY PROTEIN: deoxyuridine 5'-triphosphate nucleotidohydrolase-like n=1 Tax=Haliotis rubra TaxID=36100 RepID=UPI001EE504C6
TKLTHSLSVFSAYDYLIPAGDKIIAKTDIQIAVPEGVYGRVAPRSGLATKHFIDVGAGVIDQDYRGNVGVVMFNFGKQDFKVNCGDCIAQLICERIYIPKLQELKMTPGCPTQHAGLYPTVG